MKGLKTLIGKARKKDVGAMEELFKKYQPLLKKSSKRYARYGLEYDDVFQQAALLFILAVYQYKEMPPTTFAGYMKKRIDWGLWMYCRKYLKQKIEMPCGLTIKGESN